jgi:hypothetical protein
MMRSTCNLLQEKLTNDAKLKSAISILNDGEQKYGQYGKVEKEAMASSRCNKFKEVKPHLMHIEEMIRHCVGDVRNMLFRPWEEENVLSLMENNKASVQEAVTMVLNCYRGIMMEYAHLSRAAGKTHNADYVSQTEIYRAMNNFETAVWENEMSEPLAKGSLNLPEEKAIAADLGITIVNTREINEPSIAICASTRNEQRTGAIVSSCSENDME